MRRSRFPLRVVSTIDEASTKEVDVSCLSHVVRVANACRRRCGAGRRGARVRHTGCHALTSRVRAIRLPRGARAYMLEAYVGQLARQVCRFARRGVGRAEHRDGCPRSL
jgi:hypothetical protein